METALILCRFLHFGAAMLLWGGAAYGGADPRGRRLRWSLWALLAATGGIWLLLQAGIAGDGWSDTLDPGTLRALIAETDFGSAWMIHLGAIAALGLALAAGRGVAVTAALALATLALTGHAVMNDGMLGLAHEANAALHLLAAGYWLGALPRVAAGVRRLDAPGEGARLIRFSRLGHWAVALVIATGALNTALVLGRIPDDPASPYQALLLAKIFLVAAMVGIAIFNRYVLVPRLARSGPRGLRRGALAEIVLGALVLALVSAFATFDPV